MESEAEQVKTAKFYGVPLSEELTKEIQQCKWCYHGKLCGAHYVKASKIFEEVKGQWFKLENERYRETQEAYEPVEGVEEKESPFKSMYKPMYKPIPGYVAAPKPENSDRELLKKFTDYLIEEFLKQHKDPAS